LRELAIFLSGWDMYNDYFGLKEAPFSIAPDPRYLFMSEQHREALAHLLYGVGSAGGFVLLTGEVGTGKTTVCRCFLEQIPSDCDIAFIINPKLTALELLATICDELGISYPAGTTSIKVLTDVLNRHLLAAFGRGRNTLLIIDEAQNLASDVLEQLRLLTNLETNQRKLLQIILLGQPELRRHLERPELRQLAQRITARYHLQPLSRDEVEVYIRHRLEVAGRALGAAPLFPRRVLDRVFQLSGGVPRLINVLCDRALLGAYVQNLSAVDRRTLLQARDEVLGGASAESAGSPLGRIWPWAPLLLLAVLAVGGFFLNSDLVEIFPPAKPPEVVAPTVAVTQKIEPIATALVWPEDLTAQASYGFAAAALLDSWGVAAIAGSDLCTAARAGGLECLEARGSLDTVRRLNRPVMLLLGDDADDNGRYLTLLQVKKDAGVFAVGESRQEVSLAGLEESWGGEFTLLWRPPVGFSGLVKQGDSGPVVDWLVEQLNKAQPNLPLLNKGGVYDAELARRVRSFQFMEGLVPDGIAGVQTLIHLNQTSEEKNGPRLSEPDKG